MERFNVHSIRSPSERFVDDVECRRQRDASFSTLLVTSHEGRHVAANHETGEMYPRKLLHSAPHARPAHHTSRDPTFPSPNADHQFTSSRCPATATATQRLRGPFLSNTAVTKQRREPASSSTLQGSTFQQACVNIILLGERPRGRHACAATRYEVMYRK